MQPVSETRALRGTATTSSCTSVVTRALTKLPVRSRAAGSVTITSGAAGAVDGGSAASGSSLAHSHLPLAIVLHLAALLPPASPDDDGQNRELRAMKEKIGHLDRQKLIDYGKMRAEQGAGPVTLGIDIGVIKMIITHAAAVHGLNISPEPVDLARVALKRLGLIGKGTERDRRPTTDELNRLFRCFDDNDRLTLPMTRIVKFAVATAMRLDEICRVEWNDLDGHKLRLSVSQARL